MLLTSFVLSAAPANAGDDPNNELSKDEQKCVVEANKNVSKVMKAVGKDIVNCIKNGGKGKTDKLGGPPSTIESCSGGDVKGKVLKATGKLTSKVGDKCSGQSPAFGTNVAGSAPSTAALNFLGEDVVHALHHDIFGSNLDAAIVKLNKVTDKQDVNPTNTKLEGKCQTSIAKNSQKCFDTKWKIYNKCKKNALKGKTGPPAQHAADLEVCVASVQSDAKVTKTCLTKFSTKMGKKCGEVDLGNVLPGSGVANAAGIQPYADALVECMFCRAVNAADSLEVDCDGFDDGDPNNASCQQIFDAINTYDPSAFCNGGTTPGAPCTDPTLNFIPNSCGDGLANLLGDFGYCEAVASHSTVDASDVSEGDGAPVEIVFLLEGQTRTTCGPRDAAGVLNCSSRILNLVGQDISPIGFICFNGTNDLLGNPLSACPTGKLDCSGGNLPADQEIRANHNTALSLLEFFDPNDTNDIGSGNVAELDGTLVSLDCSNNPLLDPNTETGNPICEGMCEKWCETLGPDFEVQNANCEGHCNLGPTPNADCADHDTCDPELGGACAGGSVFAAHDGLCHCVCLDQGTGALGPAGTLYQQTALQTVIEAGGPCDGTDITIPLSAACVPTTTGTSSGLTFNANSDPNQVLDTGDAVGVPGGSDACENLRAGRSGGTEVRGFSPNFDSGVGDVITRSENVFQ